MSVHEAEKLAEKHNLIPFLEVYLTTSSIKRVTIRLKGFRPRESAIETPQAWYENFKSAIPVFSELNSIFFNLVEEIKIRYHLTKQESLNGLIGAFRLLQKKEGLRPNLNGFKFDGIQTLLQYNQPKRVGYYDGKNVGDTEVVISNKMSNKDFKVDRLIVIYVGDSNDVIRRILTNHCSGNVEASAFRKYVAEAKGYRIKRQKRPSGSVKVTINLPNPRMGEKEVSKYVRLGKWRYILCNSYPEANDFQWYVINLLRPQLNRTNKQWNFSYEKIYQTLLTELTTSPGKKCVQLHRMKSGPGVYVFYHEQKP